MKKLLFIIWLTLLTGVVQAQKTCVIASAEDHIPIREALIHTNNNHWARTDYRGYFEMKYQFDSATVSKQGYLKTTIYLKNLPDTVFLLPESKQLGTVEVWGKNQQHVRDMEGQVSESASQYGAPSAGVSFDLANMLDRRGRRDQKHLKNAKKLMSEYDRKDPIVSAYEKATGKKYQLKTPYEVELEKRDSGLVEYKGEKMTPQQRKAEKIGDAIIKTGKVVDKLRRDKPINLDMFKKEE